MTYATTLKRAALHNPAWKQVSVYTMAVDETGRAITDASGTFLVDLSELTYGLRDFTSEENFTLSDPYDGDAILIIITVNTPDPDAVILYDGIFYSVVEVRGTDAMGGTVKYRVRAVPKNEPVPIRNTRL